MQLNLSRINQASPQLEEALWNSCLYTCNMFFKCLLSHQLSIVSCSCDLERSCVKVQVIPVSVSCSCIAISLMRGIRASTSASINSAARRPQPWTLNYSIYIHFGEGQVTGMERQRKEGRSINMPWHCHVRRLLVKYVSIAFECQAVGPLYGPISLAPVLTSAPPANPGIFYCIIFYNVL